MEIVKRWLGKADEDFGFASTYLNDVHTSYFNQICFHFQQAAEKYLKSYVVAKGLKFEKVHNLKLLLELCAKDYREFKNLMEECLFLNSFYIEPRYPVDIPFETDKSDAMKAKESAKRIGDFVKKLLQ